MQVDVHGRPGHFYIQLMQFGGASPSWGEACRIRAGDSAQLACAAPTESAAGVLLLVIYEPGSDGGDNKDEAALIAEHRWLPVVDPAVAAELGRIVVQVRANRSSLVKATQECSV